MVSERTRRRIDTLLDRAEAAADARDWHEVQRLAREVLALDPDNQDAPPLVRAAEANLDPAPIATEAPSVEGIANDTPSSFVAGRYVVRRFLGEGGKKRVFLAHDERLDRDVAFALIKTDGLEEVGRERITREAQAMGRLGAAPRAGHAS